MSLDILSKQIAIDAKSDAKKIVEGAEKKAEEIIKGAEKQKKQLILDAEKIAIKTALSEKAEQIAAAKLDAKRTIEEAKEEKTEQAMEAVWKEFEKQRETKNYPKIMKALIESGLKIIGENAVVMVNEKDVQTAKYFAKHVKIKKTEIFAGAIIASEDEKIIVNNSFEAIFGERKDEIKTKLFEKIFGGKKS